MSETLDTLARRWGLNLDKLTVPIHPDIVHDFYPHVPWISLELTNRCNLKCPFCANPTLTRSKGFIEWELLEKLVAECSGQPYGINCLHGTGEPLLWDRLEDAIRLIRSRNAGLATFADNGTLLREERVRSLLDAGLTQIFISLDSLDPVVYRNTRGADLSKVIRNVQALIRIAPPTFQIYIGLMEHKDQQINAATADLFGETFGRRENVHLDKYENLIFPSAPEDYRVVKEKYDCCFRPANFMFITIDGRVAICCVDQDVLHEIGNARIQTVEDIWYSRPNQTLFRNIATGSYTCPDVCVNRCVLKTPKAAPAEIAAGFGLPYEEAFALAKELQADGRHEEARRVAEDLKWRSPWKNFEVFEFLDRPWSLNR